MKKFIIFLYLFLAACYHSPLGTGRLAESNLIDMGDIKKGMSTKEVEIILNKPFKVERVRMDKREYKIWFYLTKGTYLGQTEFIDENFTPFIFYKNRLKGWGYNFYNYFFNIDNIREREERGKYTEDKDEWPPNEHKIITPQESPVQKSIEEMIEK